MYEAFLTALFDPGVRYNRRKMFDKKRSTEQIIHDILVISKEGICKSHIVYQANLNFNIIKDYLKIVMNANLLQQTGRIYTTTPQGINYIKAHQSLQQFFLEPQIRG